MCQSTIYLQSTETTMIENDDGGVKSRPQRPCGFPGAGALGPGKSRLPSKVNAIIETAIKKIYLTDVAAVIEEVQLQCFKAKTKKPHAATVRRRVAALPDRLKLEKRESRKAAA